MKIGGIEYVFLTYFIVTCFSMHPSVQCAKILGVFSFPGRSHFILGNSLMKGLADAGHDVTVISSYEDNVPPTRGSYRNIVLPGLAESHESAIKNENFLGSQAKSTIDKFRLYEGLALQIDYSFNMTKDFLNSGEEFDVVIVEQFYNDEQKIYGHLFNAPVIVFNPIGFNGWVDYMVGNPSPLSYIPHMFTNLPQEMTFLQRVENVLYFILGRFLRYFYSFPKSRKILKKHFSNPPDITELYYNVSLVLLNAHESYSQPVPSVPNMVQIGGFHVKPPKKLPDHLQNFLDEATEGVVVFGMGSHIKSKDFPAEKLEIFTKAFGKLKEKVLWKFEADLLPGLSRNVKIVKWMPQQDVLAHPNVKAFVTHGGLLSFIEAIYHGVPMITLSVFGDQYRNGMAALNGGYGLMSPYHDESFSEERFSFMLNEVLHNPRYRENMKKRSQMFHDRPMKPMQSAIYWVEYVIRHKGATHLRVRGARMPFYQHYLLDVIAFISGVVILIFIVVILLIQFLVFPRKNYEFYNRKKKSIIIND